MAPPVPIGTFIPPVTGVNNSLAPVANSFDATGNFRNRTVSLGKRRRGPEGEILDNVFDLSRDFPLIRPPAPLSIDICGVKSLLVESAKMEAELKKIVEKGEPGSEVVMIAKSAMSLYSLVEGLIEKAVIPLCNGQWPAGQGGGNAAQPGRPVRQAAPAPPPKPTGERELREAMERADTESVLYDAHLGNAVTFNRSRLSANLSAGLKSATIAKATLEEGDVAESVRVLDDAFSGVVDVDFLGQASSAYHNRRRADDPKNGTFCTMPVKLRFTDRDSRIYFENTVKHVTGLKATQSFPKQIREEMKGFMARVRADNPERIVMIRPDARTLRLNAFVKIEGEKSWTRYHESSPIPLGIMISTVGATASAAGSQPATADGPSKEDMQTDPPLTSKSISIYIKKKKPRVNGL